MPGVNDRALAKARSLPADVLILDLEDAVAPARKAAARDQVLAALRDGGYGARELVVRVNGLDTDWGRDDLRALAQAPLHGICLPKVESPETVREAVAILDAAGAGDDVLIWAMAETPRGILHINAIAAAHPRLTALVMGTSDLAKELRVPHTPERLGFITSLGLCVLAARAHGLDILDGVHLDLDDEAGLEQACEQGRALGFDGKTLIHPKQLAAANRHFGPAAETVAQAEKIIAAWRTAEAAGSGVVLLDGKLVEALHVEEARRHLAIAEAITRLERGQ
jgi:citrate lyase subunit beta/citryl-CoA lyase